MEMQERTQTDRSTVAGMPMALVNFLYKTNAAGEQVIKKQEGCGVNSRDYSCTVLVWLAGWV